MPATNSRQDAIPIPPEELQSRETKSRGVIGCVLVCCLLLIGALTALYLTNPLRDRTILYIIIGVSALVGILLMWFVVIPLLKSFLKSIGISS